MARTPYSTIFARLFATAGGAGYSPVAPGTCGTAVAVPVVWLLRDVPLPLFAVIGLAVTALGVWAAEIADTSWGTHDSQRIVIDEVAGYMLTMLAVDRGNHWLLLLGFALFRLCDIIKPPPIRWLDRNVSGGFGVMLDDVAAGLLACLLIWALAFLGVDVLLHETLELAIGARD